ncbi:DMT family transporter [Aliiroseovarius sp. PTFE2010]|uniref:DMT family transporter n=1 Tax=Aliiroseovarius sp. PTFE2010 TaxID=3417190 RepID=UPI003CF492C3
MPLTDREALRGHLAMLAFSVLVSVSFSLGGMVAGDIAPAALNAVRFAIAATVTGIIAAALGQLRRATFDAPWRYVIIGAFYGAYFVLMFEGLKTAPPVSISAIFTLSPLLSGVLAWALLRQASTPRMTLALGIGAAGALLVIFRGDPGAMLRFEIGRGEATFLGGCVSYALFAVGSRRLNRGEATFAFSFAVIAAATGLLFVYGWADIRGTDWAALRPMVWVTILYTALAAGVVTTALQLFAVMRLPAAKVMAYSYLAPTWVALWEAMLGHSIPSPSTLAGVGLTVLALILLLRDGRVDPGP